MSAKTTTWIIALALAAAMLVSSTAFAQSATNRITGIDVEEGSDATYIRIIGSTQPTYSIYQLRNPSRIFVDIASAETASELRDVQVRNGVINAVSVASRVDGMSNMVRITVGLDRQAVYDVSIEEGTLVIQVDGTNRRELNASSTSGLEEELAAARERITALEAAATQASAQGNDEEARALREQADAERATRQDLEAQLGGARAELAQSQARSADLETRSAELEARLERAQAERDAAAREAETARREARAARASSDDAQAEAAALRAREAELQERVAEVESLRAREAQLADRIEELTARNDSRLDETRQELSSLQRELEEARSELDRQEQVVAEARTSSREESGAPTTYRVRDVRYEQEGAIGRIVIAVQEGVRYVAESWDEQNTAIVLRDAELGEHLRRRLDTSSFPGPVQSVASFVDDEGRTVILAQTTGAVASEMVRQDGDRLVWEFTASDDTRSAPEQSAEAPFQPTHTSQAAGAPSARQGSPRAMTPGDPRLRRPRMANRRISIDLRNADIQNVLRLLADEGNVNIVASDGVRGNVTLRLRSVPLDEAFALILRSNDLGWEQDGNIIRVAPMSVFEAEHERQLRALAESFALEPLAVRLLTVNYSDANQLRPLLTPLLSGRGSLAVDRRTNTLIITDVAANLDAVENLASRLDTQTPQILIEARIVETNDSFRRQLGIQWGGAMVADQAIGNATGLRFPSSVGIAGGATDGQAPTAGTASNPNFAVNLPAPAGTGEGGAIGMTFGSLSGAFNLNLRLSAAESQGTAKIVSAPRIMTLDNEQASISTGVSIPVQVVSAAGANTVFFDAQVSLSVTPRVTPDGFIYMSVQVSKSEPDFENTGARGDPSIIRRDASTQLIMRDGDTTVIGGIFQRNTGSSSSYVPFFGRLPIIGPLFRNSSQTDVRNELLVFITPRIVNRDMSIDRVGRGEEIVPPSED